MPATKTIACHFSSCYNQNHGKKVCFGNGIGSDDMEEQFDEEGMRRVQWAKRKEQMQREKYKQMVMRKIMRVAVPIAVVLLAGLAAGGINSHRKKAGERKEAGEGQGTEMTGTAEHTDSAGTPGDIPGSLQADGEDKEVGVPDGTDGFSAGDGPKDGNAVAGSGDSYGDVTVGEGEKTGKSGILITAGTYKATDRTTSPGEDVASKYAILVEIDSGNILLRREAKSRMYPASMTKVLTLLVAVENIDNLDDTFTITGEITDYCYVNDCSTAGFEKGETVTVRDLLYGTILPSGADAAVGLATYVAGSQEAFMKMMNDKLEELGLSESAHFTNCVGIYDDNHYCSVYDMAIIMDNAVNNELCRKVLSAHTYTTSATEQHPEGITISNWFLRRIEDKDAGGEVVAGKTGYVLQSGNCAVSYGVDKEGKRYICATADAYSGWKCIYDHVNMYKKYMG